MTRSQHRHSHNLDADNGARTSRTWLRTTSTRLFAHFRCIRPSSWGDVFHLDSKKSSPKFMDELNLLSGDDAEDRTSTSNMTTHHTSSLTGRNCGWWRTTHALAGRNCGWWRLAAVYSSGVLMLGVGGSDIGGRLHRRYATMQGLLGVICVYLSYAVVGWGGVMSYLTISSYLTVSSLSLSLPNKGHVGFPRLLSCRKPVLPLCLLFALVLIIGNVCFQAPFTQASHFRPQQVGGIMASRMEPNWKAESTMAGHIGGDREIEDHDLSRMPLSKLTVLGNNCGGLRRRRNDTISTL